MAFRSEGKRDQGMAEIQAKPHSSGKSAARAYLVSGLQRKSQPGSPAGQVVQRLPLQNVPYMNPAGDWTPTLDANGRASSIVATNLSLAAGHTTVPSGASNSPGVDPPSFNVLRSWGLTHPQGAPNYVRMHLLNGRLGGPGNTTANLAPGSASLNSNHSMHFEEPAIQVLNAGGTINNYTVRVAYNPPSANLVTPAGQQAWENTIQEIWGTFTYTDANGTAHPAASYNADEDPGIDTQGGWVGK